MTSNEQATGGGAPGHDRHGKLGYLEIPAVDIERSAAFYEALFRWHVDRRDASTAGFDDGTGELIGHIVTGRAVSREPGFLPYIYVEDVDATIAAAASFGSEVVESPRPEGGLTVATIRDPAGNVIGLWHG
jgi:hypothetical protein